MVLKICVIISIKVFISVKHKLQLICLKILHLKWTNFIIISSLCLITSIHLQNIILIFLYLVYTLIFILEKWCKFLSYHIYSLFLFVFTIFWALRKNSKYLKFNEKRFIAGMDSWLQGKNGMVKESDRVKFLLITMVIKS